MPASPVVVSTNVSTVKVDGEVILGLQEASFKIEGGQIHGTVKVRNTYNKFDSVLIAGMENSKSFLISVELKRGTEVVQTFCFINCKLTNSQLVLNADGIAISEYFFTGQTHNNSQIGTSVQRRRVLR